MNTTLDIQSLGRDSGQLRQALPHPASRWKSRVLLPGLILAAVAAVLLYTAGDILRSRIEVEAVPVVLRAAEESSGNAIVQAPGWVEADPHPTHITALADGIVKELLVLEGQPVRAGQVVVRLVDDDARLALARAEAEVAERAAELELAQAAAEAAQRHWDNPTERKRAVASAEALHAQSLAELQRLPSQVAVEAARLDEAREEHQRKARAAQEKAIGEMELISALSRLAAQQATLESTQAQRPFLEARVREKEAELAAAREHLALRIAEATAVRESKASAARAKAAHDRAAAARDEAQLRLQRMEVRSPVDGIVMQRLAAPGSKVMLAGDDPTSAQVLRVYDPARLQVRVDVPLADAAQVSVGQKARIVVGVLPDRTFEGEVTRLVHEADIQKNTLQYKVAIKDPSTQIRPEMLARVRFLASAPPGREGGSPQRIFIPLAALRDASGSTAKVWIIDPHGQRAVQREITLGDTRFNGWAAVTSGLSPGDQVITSDTASLRPNAAVRAVLKDAPSSAGGAHGAH